MSDIRVYHSGGVEAATISGYVNFPNSIAGGMHRRYSHSIAEEVRAIMGENHNILEKTLCREGYQKFLFRSYIATWIPAPNMFNILDIIEVIVEGLESRKYTDEELKIIIQLGMHK